MIHLTLAQLCALHQAAIEEEGRLLNIPPEYRSDEHPYMLEEQRRRRVGLLAEIRIRMVWLLKREMDKNQTD